MTEVNIGLLGLGTVGKGVYDAISIINSGYAKSIGLNFVIKKILVNNINKKRTGVDETLLTNNFDKIVNDDDIDIIIEVIGGVDTAKNYILKSFEHKKHVISANKDLIALKKSTLEKAAETNSCFFRYGASVAGGLPAIDVAKNHFTVEKITQIKAILNGTTNYILSKMCNNEPLEYEQALSEAQSLGFAEANPESDVSGTDTARKLAILSSIYFKSDITLNDIHKEGITKITKHDIEAAQLTNNVIKLIATAKSTANGIILSVYPAFVKSGGEFAKVNGGYNIIELTSEFLGKSTYKALGAGSFPTASAVISDLANIAFKMQSKEVIQNYSNINTQRKIADISDIECGYYINVTANEKVFAKENPDTEKYAEILKNHFARFDINVNKIFALNAETKETVNDKRGKNANFAVITDKTLEKNINSAIKNLEQEKNVSVNSIIRIEDEI